MKLLRRSGESLELHVVLFSKRLSGLSSRGLHLERELLETLLAPNNPLFLMPTLLILFVTPSGFAAMVMVVMMTMTMVLRMINGSSPVIKSLMPWTRS